MDVLGWITWLFVKVLGLAWGVVWFLLGGWVATLAQIGVLVLLILGYKYGWRHAPQEVLSRARRLFQWGWSWIRTREPKPAESEQRAKPRRANRARRTRRRPNLSTVLSILVLAGLAAMALI